MALHRYRTRYGTVLKADGCRDDYPNIKTVTIGSGRRAETYTLQAPAIRSLRVVAARLGGPWRPRAVKVTGTIRSCEYQAQLYAQDSSRYAHPASTLHTHGLAIDVDTNFLRAHPEVKRMLLNHGWNQSRPVDEPWHFSFRLTA